MTPTRCKLPEPGSSSLNQTDHSGHGLPWRPVGATAGLSKKAAEGARRHTRQPWGHKRPFPSSVVASQMAAA
jgi:hypothetical protein